MFKNIKIYLLLLIAFSLFSCNKENLENENSVIYVRYKGATMPTYIHGNAASKTFILIVHGGPGGNGLEYRSGIYAEELEKDYAMVYWDQRGQGSSHGNYFEEDVTVAQFTEDLHAVILSIKHKYGNDIKLFLMGHSWGGTLGSAFMVTENYQEDVSGWIEVDGAHNLPLLNKTARNMFIRIGSEQLNLNKNTDFWQEVVNFCQGLDSVNISIEQAGHLNQYAHQAENNLDEISNSESNFNEAFIQLLFSPTSFITSDVQGNKTSDLLLDEVEKIMLSNQLNKISKPTLLLWGRYDFVVPPELAEDAFQNIVIPEKEIVYFENSGHSPMNNEPELFVQAVRNFVEKYR